jgi:predicted transcriptional regulator of viral defense system
MDSASAPPMPPDSGTSGFLWSLQSQGRYLFRTSEFAAVTRREPGEPAVKSALARLSRSGKITSLVKRPSTWLIVPPEQAAYGAPPITWWLDDFLRQAEPNYYLALLSAARYWGSAHYAIQATQVVVSRKRAQLRVGRLRLDFTAKAAAAQTPTVKATGGVAGYRVSTREATLLDLMRHSKDVGGLEAVVRIAKDFVPAMSNGDMTDALVAMAQTPVAQRIGFVLSHLAKGLHKPVEQWLANRRTWREPLERGAAELEGAVLFSPEWHIEYTPRQLQIIKELA